MKLSVSFGRSLTCNSQRRVNGANAVSSIQGYYSIIQYCPDLGKFEAANVGVLLFCPEKLFLKAMTASNNRRIIRVFGSKGHDWARINTFKRGLEERLEKESQTIASLDDLQQFIAMRANVLQITRPNPTKVQNPESDLRKLFEEIIGEPARAARGTSLLSYVADRLAGPGLERKVVHGVKVTVPVWQREVEIPFVFQKRPIQPDNARSIWAQDPDQSVNTACKYAVEGRSLYESTDAEWGEMQLLVLGQFRTNDADTVGRVNRVLHEHRVRLFKLDDLPTLVDEIRRTGKPIGPAEGAAGA